MPGSAQPDDCQPDRLERRSVGPCEWLIHRLSSTESTNDLARKWLESPQSQSPAAWIAGIQTAGRGTRGRGWSSPSGGLWLSVAMSLGPNPQVCLPGLGLRVGLATLRAVRAVVPEKLAGTTRLRWPNDLVAESDSGTLLKIGGTIIDHISSSVVIGIGINANNPAPRTDPQGDPLRTEAASLCELTGLETPMQELENGILAELGELIPTPGLPDPIADELDAALWKPATPVTVTHRPGDTTSGLIVGISRDHASLGGLIIESADGAKRIITSGDVR